MYTFKHFCLNSPNTCMYFIHCSIRLMSLYFIDEYGLCLWSCTLYVIIESLLPVASSNAMFSANSALS